MQDTRWPNWFAAGLLLTAALTSAARSGETVPAEENAALRAAQRRRPVALALLHSEPLLLIANRRSGSVSVIDTAKRQVVAEHKLAESLTDLAVLPGEARVLALDANAGQLLTLARQGVELEVVARTDVGASPVSISLSKDGRFAFVASLWGRRLIMLSLEQADQPRVIETFELPFAPRLQRPLADGQRLVVADAFGGRLAVIDFAKRRVAAVHELPAHNLSGLTLSPDGRQLLVSHQVLNPLSPTDGESVHWGGVMKNLLHVIDVSTLGDRDADLDPAGSRYYLGYPDRAAGDPGPLLVSEDGRRVVAFSGVNELAVSDAGANYFRRIAVGRRPIALALGANGELWVANQLSDSVTLVDVEQAKVVSEIELGPHAELSAIDRGERLFYDATLSRDGWFSCHACHTDGHTNGLASDNFGDTTYGAPKLTPTLLGTADTGPWAWNGGQLALRDQIRRSIEVTMQGAPPTDGQVNDLVAYLETLEVPPSLTAMRGKSDAEQFKRGREIFAARNCVDCHTPPTYTSDEAYDVGLADELGARRFNPPSLRGVSQRDRLLHDGRSGDLLEAIRAHQPDVVRALNNQDRADLLHFLQSL